VDVGLARVSTLDQDPQLQLDALEQAGCWPIYEEKVSGVSDKRPVRDQALVTLKTGDTLTVWKLDRLGRSMVEIVSIVEDLTKRGVRFRSLTQPIDTTDPTGRLQLQLLAAFAEFERAIIKERTVAGKQARIRKGLHPGGARAYGWSADHTTVIEEEAAVLRAVAQDLVDGIPFARVVDHLNGELDLDKPETKVPPNVDRLARPVVPVKGGRWRVNTLQGILLNPRAATILGQEQYQNMVKLLAGKRRPGRLADHLLSGILTCGRDGCGQPLYAATVRPQGQGKKLVYRCQRLGGGRFSGCGRTSVSLPRADEWAEEAFVAAVVSEDFAQALAQRQAELLAGTTTVEELDDWRAEMDDLEQVQGTRYYNDTMRRRYDDLRRMVRQATQALVQRPDLQALIDLPKSEDQLRARWASWDVATRRVWLRRLVYTVVVKPATGRGRASDVESRLEPVWKL
jgi:DNA invertase Pin-like site-specific DNA recombinase